MNEWFFYGELIKPWPNGPPNSSQVHNFDGGVEYHLANHLAWVGLSWPKFDQAQIFSQLKPSFALFGHLSQLKPSFALFGHLSQLKPSFALFGHLSQLKPSFALFGHLSQLKPSFALFGHLSQL